jgi:predicted ArsR family transcriptional regulator
MNPRLNKRFWESTRGRIVLLLRRGSRTVTELAEALALTDNAVRTHRTALERDGLVRASGTRSGVRKPPTAYGLAPEAEQLFPKAYGPVLRHLLDVLNERLPSKKLDEIVGALGERLAAAYRPALQPDQTPDHAELAVTVLQELGGCCEPERQNGVVVLGCAECPLAVVAEGHPEVCQLVEAVLANVLGVPVRQRCRAEPTPQCCFEIDGAAASG